MDTHCRITVVGSRHQVDLAVPATAPITTYVDDLARMCGQQQVDPLPSAWSLAAAAQPPFAPERSLAELGVVDGQVLHLCDIVADEYADPVVYDVGERVAELAESHLQRRWSARTRTITAMAAGICLFVATLVVLATGAWIGPVALTCARVPQLSGVLVALDGHLPRSAC
jgi:type VII secretion integral membrane protein EccD